MNKDDLILISVDDHIAEPADMFDAHVPAKYKEKAPRVVLEPDGIQQWYYGEVRGRNMGLNAVAGKPREMYNIDASRYDDWWALAIAAGIKPTTAQGWYASRNRPKGVDVLHVLDLLLAADVLREDFAAAIRSDALAATEPHEVVRRLERATPATPPSPGKRARGNRAHNA